MISPSQKNKIILLGPVPPPFGGVAIFLNNLYKNLRDPDIKFWTQTPVECSNNAIHIKSSLFKFPFLLLKDGRRSTVVDSTLVFLEYPDQPLSFFWQTLRPILGIKWIKIIHDNSLPNRLPSFPFYERLLAKLALKTIDEFIVVNQDLFDWLKHDLKLKQKITLVKPLLPIDLDLSAVTLPRELLSLAKAGKKLVCTVGTFVPQYGFRETADTIEKLREELGEDIRLIIVSGTFTNDSSYEEDVLRNRDWISVVRDIPHRQTLKIIQESDLAVRATSRESYGLTRVEAICLGTPVVATDFGETRGVLTFEHGNHEEMKKQIKEGLYNFNPKSLSNWADQYKQEAQQNLRAFKDIIYKHDPHYEK